jgi:hypothetical protein
MGRDMWLLCTRLSVLLVCICTTLTAARATEQANWARGSGTSGWKGQALGGPDFAHKRIHYWDLLMQNPSGMIRLGAGGQTAAGSNKQVQVQVQYMYGHSGRCVGFWRSMAAG